MKMMCSEVLRSLDWFLDDELDLEATREIEQHVHECVSCREMLMQAHHLRKALQQSTNNVVAPISVVREVRNIMERERPRTKWVRAWPAVAAAAVLVAFIWRNSTTSFYADLDIVSRVPDLPMDVVAADVNSVQAYFRHKLPFAVQLPRIAEGAVHTLGGRVMNVHDRDTAYIRYSLPRGQMSMFVYENKDEDLPEVAPMYRIGNQRMIIQQMRGYTVARWNSGGLTYSIVTDLPVDEFSKLIRANPW